MPFHNQRRHIIACIVETKLDGMIRKAGLMGATSMLGTLGLAKLKIVQENLGAIIRGEYKMEVAS